MANYRAHVLDSEAAGDGTVHFDCVIQKEVIDPGPPIVTTWEDVPRGHRTLVLGAAAVLAITEDPGLTDPQKRAALSQLFKTEAQGWGIDESDAAETDILALIPAASWPVNVDL